MPASKSRIPNGFKKALAVGRPPNVVKLFPNSNALLVSGKYIDRAMLARGQGHRHRRQRPQCIRHPRRVESRPAGQRRHHHRNCQIRGRRGGLLRGQLLEHGPHRGRLSATSWASRCRWPSTPTTTASRAPRTSRPPETEIPSMFDAGITSIAIDASHLPGRPESAGEHRAHPARPQVGRPRDRSRRDQGQGGPLHTGGGPFPDPGPERPRHLPGLDRVEQRHHPRHRGQRLRHPGGPHPAHPRGDRPIPRVGRPARHLRQQLRTAAGDRRPDPHHQGQCRHRAADDLLGSRGERLRQRHPRCRRQLHQGQGPGRQRGDVGGDGGLCPGRAA